MMPDQQHRPTEVEHRGLTESEVAERVASGRANIAPQPIVRSLQAMIRSNVLTPVNAIMLVLFALIMISGHWRDGLFVGVVLTNSIVGVTQEMRARSELARLEVVSAATTTVIRNGTPLEIDSSGIVLDDLIVMSTGEQVAVDGTVVSATGMQMDESMLTGESKPVLKDSGDTVMSGSFVVAGHGRIVATAVGADSYAAQLATEAKTFNAAESHLRKAINRILHWLTIIIPVASVLLLISLLDAEPRWQDALQGTVAAAVAMVPDGLVLLTSLAFVAGVLQLTKRNALAKQLSTVEVLARVDVLCLDKTGTITTGEIAFAAIHPIGDTSDRDVREALSNLAVADESPNATMQAIAAGVGRPKGQWTIESIEPFSSLRKWSAVSFVDHGWFFIGAPDFLLAEGDPAAAVVTERSGAGQRLIAMVHSDTGPDGDNAPTGSTTMAIIELEDEIRPEAAEILAYFADQDVSIKVISGDNHDTVFAIATRAGLAARGNDNPIDAVDARTLPTDQGELADTMQTTEVFGRVSPQQKQAMVRALQSRGHVVAMTGDGVNDVLALKDADLGIAMGSGSAAARSVADLVLTDDSFASLPTVLAEGRKVINNVERVANLFVTKAAYAVLITLIIGVLGSPFPFLPRQLTLIGTFSIGIPGFFLALAPEVERVRDGFFSRVLRFSIPAGIIAGIATTTVYEVARRATSITLGEARTLATITLLGIGLMVVAVASRPLATWKIGLVIAMAAGYGVLLLVPWARRFFELDLFTGPAWLIAAGAVAGASALIAMVPTYADRIKK